MDGVIGNVDLKKLDKHSHNKIYNMALTRCKVEEAGFVRDNALQKIRRSPLQFHANKIAEVLEDTPAAE